MTIRRATPLDLEGILSVEKEWEREYPCWGRSGFLKEFDKENSYTFIALIDEIIAGFINIWLFEELIEINSVVVSKGFLRKGVATNLIRYVFSFGKERGTKRVILEVNEKNTAALKLYSSLGFNMYNVRKKYYDFKYDAIMMEVFL